MKISKCTCEKSSVYVFWGYTGFVWIECENCKRQSKKYRDSYSSNLNFAIISWNSQTNKKKEK